MRVCSPAEHQVADKSAQERTGDPYQDRSKDADGIRARNEQSAECSDYETAQDQQEDQRKHDHSPTLDSSVQLRQRPIIRSPSGR